MRLSCSVRTQPSLARLLCSMWSETSLGRIQPCIDSHLYFSTTQGSAWLMLGLSMCSLLTGGVMLRRHDLTSVGSQRPSDLVSSGFFWVQGQSLDWRRETCPCRALSALKAHPTPCYKGSIGSRLALTMLGDPQPSHVLS